MPDTPLPRSLRLPDDGNAPAGNAPTGKTPAGNTPAGTTPAGNTPLDGDELDALLPAHLHTNGELNQWEALNIAQAHDWLARRRSADPLRVEFLADLHGRMFDRTWKWAGTFRRSDKNISPHHWTQVPVLLHELVENTRAQVAASGRTPAELDDVAMRFHHVLVRVHPWPNGNGRHARLATDVLLVHWGRPPFSWGEEANLAAMSAIRAEYIAALQRADGGDYEKLRRMVRG